MAKLKLELRFQSDTDLIALAQAHKAALAVAPGSGLFPTPLPTVAALDALIAALSTQLAAVAAAETALETARALRDAARGNLEDGLRQRAAYAESVTSVEANLAASGLPLQSTGSATTELPAPANLAASIGDEEGEVDLSCNAVRKARSYIWECATHDPGQPQGTWTVVKLTSKSSLSVMGLTSGKKYAFRVRALGPNDLQSPWSDEAVCMAG